MKIKRIEHVGVWWRDTEASRKLWKAASASVSAAPRNTRPARETCALPGRRVDGRAVVRNHGRQQHARMVAEGKGGLNHICFEVEDIDERWRAEGKRNSAQ